MRLVELGNKTEYDNFSDEEIAEIKNFAKHDYSVSIDTPFMVSISYTDDNDDFHNIDITKEKSNKEPGMFHYRVGSTVSTDEDEFPGSTEFVTVAFHQEDSLRYLKKALERIEE